VEIMQRECQPFTCGLYARGKSKDREDILHSSGMAGNMKVVRIYHVDPLQWRGNNKAGRNSVNVSSKDTLKNTKLKVHS